MAKKASKKKRASKKRKRARPRRVGRVSAAGQAGNVTASDTPLHLSAETNPANWSPPPSEPLPRPRTSINAGQVSSPLRPQLPDQDTDAGEESLAVEFLGSAEDPVLLHQTLMGRVAVLEAAVQQLRSPVFEVGPGHNQPPPDEPAFVPVTPNDLDEIDRLIALLKEQPPVPPTVPVQLAAQSRVVARIGAKISNLADIFAKEAVKSAGHEVGKRLVQIPFWWGILYAINEVTSALQQWIAVLPN
jgi:hypothetical protein